MSELVSSATAYLRQRVLFFAAALAPAWVLHTYLIVFVNEGVNPGTVVGDWLGIRGNAGFAFFAWLFLSGLLWGFFFTLKVRGRGPALRVLLGPMRLATPLLEFMHNRQWGLVAIGAGTGLLVAAWSQFLGRELVLLALFWAYFWSQGVGGRCLPRVVSVFPEVTYPAAMATMATEDEHAQKGKAVLGILGAFVVGLLLAGWLGHPGSLRVGLPLVAVGIVFNVWRSRSGPRGSALPVLLLAVALETLCRVAFPESFFADDGGWIDSGGNFASWWADSGSGDALRSGIAPASGAAFGVGWGDALSDAGDQGDSDPVG